MVRAPYSASEAACLVCSSTDVAEAGGLSVNDLVAGYRRFFKLDVSACFIGLDRLLEKHCRSCDLRYFWPVVTGDERFYASLSSRSWYYMEEKPEFILAQRYLKPSDRVLEAGAGRGAFAQYCPGEYVGLEFNQAGAERAKQEGIHVRVETLESHAEHHAGAYDVSCAFQVLEHVADPRGFVSMLALLTRPGGRIILSVPSEDSFPGETLNAFLNLPPHHVTRWTEKALIALGATASLKLEAIEHEPLADYHLGWYLAQQLYRGLAPSLVARPGHRTRLDVKGYMLWRSLWLLGAMSARLLKPWVARSAKAARGHSLLAVLRKL